MPIRLTAAELDAVLAAAKPLARDVRDAFLQHVAAELSTCAEIGPGTVHRVCRETQRKFFDPPDIDGRGGSQSKYR
jgi:hypothetical protein